LAIAGRDGSFDSLLDWTTEYLQLGFGWGSELLSNDNPSVCVNPGGFRCHGEREGWNTQSLNAKHSDRSEPIELERLLDQAVSRRLEADVPLGCFLSGGIDSSLVAHYALRHKPDLHTFSVRMPDARYDESRFAEQVAFDLGAKHTTLAVAFRPAEDLLRLISLLGQPFGDSSILPTYWVSQAARSHVKVALSGDGGDEIFVGYERYLVADLLARHWRLLRLLPSALHHRAHPKSLREKVARLGDMARDYRELEVCVMESIFTQTEIRLLMDDYPIDSLSKEKINRSSSGRKEQFFEAIGSGSCATLSQYGLDDCTALNHLRRIDIEQYLPNDLLTKVDTASMACGLEVRCPFLDRDLARAALSMPIEQLMPGGQRKGLLRNIARKYLPKEIVDRPKMGFAIPIGEWFRDDDLPHPGGGMKTLLLDHLNSAEPFGPIQLNRKAVQRFIDEHMSGKRDHGQRLFTLLTLSIWARQMKDLKPAPA
jgi:asparagine synthase (glutamine-hydrolysing)